MRENSPVDEHVIDEDLPEQYPTDAVERAKARLLKRADIAREDGAYIYNRG